MVSKHLLLPVLAMGLAFYAPATSARSTQLLNSAQPNQQHLHFVENKGQIVNQFQQPRPDIDFRLSAGNGLNIFIGSGEIHCQWAKPNKESGHGKPGRTAGHELGASAKDMDAAPAHQMYRMDVALIGANSNATVLTAEKQSFYERYYLPGVGANGAIAHAFHKITYKNVYPNIDWVLYVKNNAVEYDFVVRPGGNVSDIKLKYDGATTLKTTDGNLIAATPLGSITENAPYSFQEDGKTVSSKFILENDILSFDVDDYSGTLTIDPVLEWGTYFGAMDFDGAKSVATDKYNNIYMVGNTANTSNIATTGAYQTIYGGGSFYDGADAYVTKWSQNGNLLWSTYYGGEKIDVAQAVECDTTGSIYLAGYTSSSAGIATTGSYQDIKAGTANRYDAFLVKFDSSGQRLWGTYYGGDQNESNNSMGLACDKFNNVYITGNTQSTSAIATTGSSQTSFGGSEDAFLAKFDATGQIDWATYYGGSDEDNPFNVAIDAAGNVYLTGYTLSTNGIGTSSAYQPVNGGGEDAFLAKFNTSGQKLWSTYYGGAGQDRSYLVTTLNNRVFIAGISGSSSAIATAGSFQDTLSGGLGNDGFVASFDTSGSRIWGTYYGGDKPDLINGIAANATDGIYISGMTFSDSGISSIGSYQTVLSGLYDLFLVKFDTAGQRQWGTYYGGIDIEMGGYVAVDKMDKIYLAGQTNSASGISTNGTYQTALSGDNDAFLVCFNDCEIPGAPDSIIGPDIVCSGTENMYKVNPVPNASSYVWELPPNWTGTSSTDSILVINNGNDGVLKVTAISACGGVSDTQSINITVLSAPQPVIVNDNNILSTNQSFASYQWIFNGQDISGANGSTYIPTEDGYYSVRVENEEGCNGVSDSVSVTGTIGIEEIRNNSAFSVYPNPAKNHIMIQAPQKAVANLLSIDGRILKTKIPLKKGDNEILLNGLSDGMYWLKIETGTYIQVTKIIIR